MSDQPMIQLMLHDPIGHFRSEVRQPAKLGSQQLIEWVW